MGRERKSLSKVRARVTIKRNTEIFPALESEATKRMYAATARVQKEVVETLSGDRTGRRYRVPGTNRFYTASAPGEPPAVQLGDLRMDVQEKGVRVFRKGQSTKGHVGSTLDKAVWLEKGTKHMAPRPWLQRSFDSSKEEVKEILSRKWF